MPECVTDVPKEKPRNYMELMSHLEAAAFELPLENCNGNSAKPEHNDKPITNFKLDHAKALVQCSALTYLDNDDIERIAKKWGFNYVNIITRGESQAVLLGNGKQLVVAFRGSNNVQTLQDVSDPSPTDDSVILDQPVHGKFFKYLHSTEEGQDEALWHAVDKAGAEYIDKHPEAKVYMTGHSMGGALALLGAATLLQEYGNTTHLTELYSFGSPPIAQETFNEKLDEELKGRYFLVHNAGDELAAQSLEKDYGYSHTEKRLVRISASGAVTKNGTMLCAPNSHFYAKEEGNEDNITGNTITSSTVATVADMSPRLMLGIYKHHHTVLSYLHNIDFAIATESARTTQTEPDTKVLELQAERLKKELQRRCA